MGKQFDELSKDLVRGMSRRRALWRFGAGVAGVVAARFGSELLSEAGSGSGSALAAQIFPIPRFCTTNSTNINGTFLDFSAADRGQRIIGTDGDDVIIGSRFNDQIDARGGNDCVFGGDGNDQILGGPGNDDVFGQRGNDQLIGDGGNDELDGGQGTDACAGDEGSDFAANCEQTTGVP